MEAFWGDWGVDDGGAAYDGDHLMMDEKTKRNLFYVIAAIAGWVIGWCLGAMKTGIWLPWK